MAADTNWEKGSIVLAKAYVSDKPTYGRNIQQIARCTSRIGSWAERNLYRAEFEAPVPVFILGKSLRVAGYREWQGEDVGTTFVPQHYVPVWMVVPMDRNFSYRKPFAVLPEDIEYDRKYARAHQWRLSSGPACHNHLPVTFRAWIDLFGGSDDHKTAIGLRFRAGTKRQTLSGRARFCQDLPGIHNRRKSNTGLQATPHSAGPWNFTAELD